MRARREATLIANAKKYGFPKSVRLLRSSDFRKVYDNGTRYTCPHFAAFCLAGPPESGTHIGFTTPRALGKAVVRNRLRRRVREATRLELSGLSGEWSIVINPRRRALDCTLGELQAEVKRLFIRCTANSQPAFLQASPSRTELAKPSDSSSEATSA